MAEPLVTRFAFRFGADQLMILPEIVDSEAAFKAWLGDAQVNPTLEIIELEMRVVRQIHPARPSVTH